MIVRGVVNAVSDCGAIRQRIGPLQTAKSLSAPRQQHTNVAKSRNKERDIK